MAPINPKQFEILFRDLFTPLVGFAVKYVRDQDEAKGIVHDVFVGLWEKFETLPVDANHRSYLFTSVKNRCLNSLRDRKRNVTIGSIPESKLSESDSGMETEELEKEIIIGIAALPEKCRMVFELSRQGGLKYTQIAEKMGISVKTVEAQMTKAMSLLRVHLKDFLSLIFFITVT